MSEAVFHLQFSIDTFYFLVCGAFVMWMAAGFAMLEAGLVRSKNTTEILTKNVALFAIACTAYLLTGYQIMYGGGWMLEGIAGSDSLVQDKIADFKAQSDISGSSIYAQSADFFFQVVFVATAMSIVSGAVAERMKLWSFLIFAFVMTAFIYPVEGSWTWGQGNGWGVEGVFGLFALGDDITLESGEVISGFGFSDFAGSGIVHMAGGAAALAAVIILGPRKGKYNAAGAVQPIPGSNLPLATLGTFILWMGWFGFNGGSVLKLGDIANANSVAIVFVNTNAAAATGALGALLCARALFGKADLTMLLNGALAGLVVITAEPSTPTPLQASLFGLLGGILVVISVIFFDRVKIDDPVGAISVHGVAGLLGLLLVPVTNESATVLGQVTGALTIFSWVFITSLAVWWLINLTIGVRVSEEDEYLGMDISECGMEAYPEFVSSSKS